MGGGGSFPTPPGFPTNWNVTEFAGNPVITVGGGEPDEQYDPAPILRASDIQVLVKGAIRIYAWGSTDGTDGEAFAGLNGGSAVIPMGGGGSWNSTYSLEPAALFDAGADVIHAWFKGSNGGAPGWGHATRASSAAGSFTEDGANPILTAAQIGTELGGTVTDTAPFDVIVSGGVYYFFGYAQIDGQYLLILATGTTWNDPDPGSLVVLYDPADTSQIAGTGCVFQVNGVYGMFYTYGALSGTGREIRVAQSASLGSGWDFSDTSAVIANSSGWEADWAYTPRLLKESAAPYLAPIVDGMGRWKMYYSGMNLAANESQAGLAYLEPA